MCEGTTEMTESLPIKSDACLTTGPNGMQFIHNRIDHNDCMIHLCLILPRNSI